MDKRKFMLCHSMGGPFIQQFLSTYVDKEWKNKYIGKFFSMCGSYDGSNIAVPTMIWGKFYTFPANLHKVLPYMGGLIWSIPNHIYVDDVFFMTDKRNYTLGQLKDLFTDMGKPKVYDIFTYLKQAEVTNPPGVETYCFRGLGVKTAKVMYQPKIEWGKDTKW